MQFRMSMALFAAVLLVSACVWPASCDRKKPGRRSAEKPAAAGKADPLARFEKDLCEPGNAARLMQGDAITEFTARINYAQFPAQATIEEYIAEAKTLASSTPAPPAEKYDSCSAAAQPMACAAVYDQIAKASQRMIEEQKALFADVSDDYMKDLDLPEAVTTQQAAAAGRAMGVDGCAAVTVNAARAGGETLSATFFAGSIKGEMQIFYMNPDTAMQ